jgi:hypothetical protein
MLSLQGPVVQVSHGARVPADIALEVVGDQVLVVWSDARGASGAGRADLFGCLLGARDARPLGSETKLVTTAGHAHGARLAVVGGDSGKTAIRLLWVESAPEDGSKFGRARSVLLDEDGRPTTPVFEIPLPPHVADTSLECKSGACRALTVVAQPGPVDAAQLWSIVFGSDEASVDLLHPLQANAPTAVVPVLAGGVGYFSDYVPEDDTWRLWRMEIDWGGAPSE